MSETFELNDVFPKVCDEVIGYGGIERNLHYYPYLLQCLENVQKRKSIVAFLKKNSIDRVGLYAINEFMDYIIRDIEIDSLEELRVYDKNAQRYESGHLGQAVCDFDMLIEDYKNSLISKIIICNLYHANEIANSLICKGVKGEDIISVDMLIYAL